MLHLRIEIESALSGAEAAILATAKGRKGNGRMKRAIFFVILALFLSAGSNVKSASDDPNKTRSEGQQQYQSRKKIAPIRQEESTQVPTTYGPGSTYSYQGKFNYGPTYSAPPESRWAIAGHIAAIVSSVLIMIFTGGLWWTSIRQWRAIKAQIDLQTIQWVAYENWRCRQREGHPNKIQVLFDVINQSNFPLRFVDADISFELDGKEERPPFIQNWVLTPHSPRTISVWLSPTHAQFQEYLNNNALQVRVRAEISYIGVRRERQDMTFEGVVWCGRRGSWFVESTKSS